MGQILKELEDLRKGKEHKTYKCTNINRKWWFFAKYVYSGFCKVFREFTGRILASYILMSREEN